MKKVLLFWILLGSFTLQAANEYFIYDTMQVIHNSLHIDVLQQKDKILHGKADITIRSKQDVLQYAPFLLLKMQIDSVRVDGHPVTAYQYNDTLLRVPLASGLKKGDETRISIAYHGTPECSVFGGMMFSDHLEMVHNMGVSIEDIPHSFGRSWFPATDDFRSRSTFDLYIRAEQGKKAVASGLLKDTLPGSDGMTIWHWRVDQPIPDYLVSLAVAPYEQIHFDYLQDNRTLPIDIYILPGEKETAEQTYRIVPKILEIMEKHFGEYPFDRVGYVSVNSPHGAMEHVANISMPKDPIASVDYQTTVIHELIHAWFGNRVTCATAQDMWLNEGITSFFTEIVLSDIFSPEIAARETRVNHQIAVVRAPQQDQTYYALSQVPQAFTYHSTVYCKGAAVMRTLYNYLGEEVLFPALKKYLETYTFRAVTTSEFQAFLSAETGVDLNDFFNLWVDQPGFPVFEIDSIRGVYTSVQRKKDPDTFPSGSYRGTLYIEQKLCHALHYGRNVRLPVTFYDASGRQSRKLYLSVSGRYTAVSIDLPFVPAYGLVDADYEICKGSTLDRLHMDAPGSYPAPACLASILAEAVTAPVDIQLEYYGVAPDPTKHAMPWQLSDTHYWRLTGRIPSSCRLTGRFSLDKQWWDQTLLADPAKDLLVLYRKDPADDWQKIRTISAPTIGNEVTVPDLKAGEYCLAIHK